MRTVPALNSSTQFCWGRQLSESLAPLDRPAFIDSAGVLSWAEWLLSVERMTTILECFRGYRVGLPLRPCSRAYAIFAALSSLNCDIYLLDELWTEETLDRLQLLDGLDVIIGVGRPIESEEPSIRELRRPDRREREGMVTIFTSGSTGLPKPVRHNWATLTRPVRRGSLSKDHRWLLTYRPHLYAGLQVFFQALLQQGTLVMPERDASAADLVELMLRAEVNAVSATPSYWRRILMHGDVSKLNHLNLDQITLGGEVTNQTLLDALKRAFPKARIVHIYATSELGRCFSVKDGLEGFPASYLTHLSEEGVELRVEQGELLARSSNGEVESNRSSDLEAQTSKGWIATGDLVRKQDDRFIFDGRKSDLINVGGNKVQPLKVEQLILTIPGVRDVRVFAKKSSLVGQMVACEFVMQEGRDAKTVEQDISKACRESLASYEVPRFLNCVPSIALSDANKKIRGAR